MCGGGGWEGYGAVSNEPLHPAPHTVFPAPLHYAHCTPHPLHPQTHCVFFTPALLHCASCTPHPLNPPPHTVHHIPHTMLSVPCNIRPALWTPATHFLHPVPYVPATLYPWACTLRPPPRSSAVDSFCTSQTRGLDSANMCAGSGSEGCAALWSFMNLWKILVQAGRVVTANVI